MRRRTLIAAGVVLSALAAPAPSLANEVVQEGNFSAVCSSLGSQYSCAQSNDAWTTQTALAGHGGNGGSGDAAGDGGDGGKAKNKSLTLQKNQIAGRDAGGRGMVILVVDGGGNFSAVCNSAASRDSCSQSNKAGTTQTSTAGHGGHGGNGTNGGDGGNGGKAKNKSLTLQKNQIAGRDTRGGWGGENESAVCNSAQSHDSCEQSNDAKTTQTATAGHGGHGGSGGQFNLGDSAAGDGGYGGDAHNGSLTGQSNQIAGNDTGGAFGIGSNGSSVCSSADSSDSCAQSNDAKTTQTATGGNGGNGGNGGTFNVAVGPYASAGNGGNGGNGGDAHNGSFTGQSNQIAGNNAGGLTAGINFTAVCNSAQSHDSCAQSNSASTTQTATGGNGGNGGNGGTFNVAVGPYASAGNGGNGGDGGNAANWSLTAQGNQIAGNNTHGGSAGLNGSAVCSSAQSQDSCAQSNSSWTTQTSTAGNGGNGGNGGTVNIAVGPYASAGNGGNGGNGGNAGNWSGTIQGNQIAGNSTGAFGGGTNLSATCNSAQSSSSCAQSNTSTTTQTAKAGNGGSGGDAGAFNVPVGPGATAGQGGTGGDGGYAANGAGTGQGNAIAGNDTASSQPAS